MEDKEPEKEKRGSKKRNIIAILIILLCIHLVLILSRITVTRPEYVEEEVPYDAIETYTDNEGVEIKECYEKDFNYRYVWEGWIPEKDGLISPKFRLINEEEREGKFDVHFAFFDDSIYPYTEYKGINYDLVKDKLAWSNAAMHSETVSHTLGPLDNVLIVISTKKKELNGVYWAYADVVVPYYRECNSTISDKNVTRNKTVTRYKKEYVKKDITKTMTLWQLLVEWIKKRT